MKTVVISQPMFFPWVGLFEQIRLADVYVHYDDVQFSRGFLNRVQVKTPNGPKWLTLPLAKSHGRPNINRLACDESQDWRREQFTMLSRVYAKAPHVREMLDIAQSVYALPTNNLAEITMASMAAVCRYFDLVQTRFEVSSRLGIPGSSSQRLLDIVESFDGTTYVTGHGALDYLDHELFEAHQVTVEYMEYQKRPYPQLYGPFTPFVSILDLIANCGRAGREVICSGTVSWKQLVQHERS